ncbi:hypothetical protein D9M73_278300 [compost metagenome]
MLFFASRVAKCRLVRRLRNDSTARSAGLFTASNREPVDARLLPFNVLSIWDWPLLRGIDA